MSEFDWLDDTENQDFSYLGDDYQIESDVQLERPIVHERRVSRRQMLVGMKRENLARLLPTLPPPDTDLLILSNGEGAETGRVIDDQRFDFGSFIPHAVELMGNRDCDVFCSTWVMNSSHVEMLLGMLADRRINRLSILTDPFFRRRHTASVAHTLVSGLSTYGDRARILFFKNHAKVLAITDATQTQFLSVQGNSNLTAVARVENYHVSSAESVFRFYSEQFFETIFKEKSNVR